MTDVVGQLTKLLAAVTATTVQALPGFARRSGDA